jgi:hypothetical protein
MDTTQTLMERCKVQLGVESDYALAKALETSTAAVSRYRTGERQMDNWCACKVALILGLDPMEVIAISELEREKNETKRKFWENFYRERFAKLAIVLAFMAGIWTICPSESLQNAADFGVKTVFLASESAAIVCGGVFLPVLALVLVLLYIIDLR